VPRTRAHQPKQIVYLLGAGATQAEVEYLGARPVNLMMRDSARLGEGVSTAVLQRAGPRWRPVPAGQDLDIEKLISLLGASGVNRLVTVAEQMRRGYFDEILRRLRRAGIIERPQLAKALFEMHKRAAFRRTVETLSGVITTNHDGLLQVASQQVFGQVALGFPFLSDGFSPATAGSVPFVLQLHGSFTWRLAVPPRASPLHRGSRYSPDTLWIPPSILKESKNYPFNKVLAMAYELLARRCDVLRVVGASLTQNDWNILSLIFNAQRHKELARGTAFKIEVIASQRGGERIAKESAYLKNITPIGYLTEGSFADYKDYQEKDPPASSDLTNPFAYWLKEKIRYHRSRGELGDAPLSETMARVAGEAP
jgi:hypothetical protein